MCQISGMFTVVKTLTLINFLCAIQSGICQEPKDEGDSCQKLGLPGICKKVRDCAVAKEQIREKFRHDLLRCSFIGTEEVVCCPDLTFRHPQIEATTLDSSIIWTEEARIDVKNDKNPPNTTKKPVNKRISEKMCEKIYKDNNIRRKFNYNILGGEDAQIGEFPHMAAIGFKTGFDEIDFAKCGASLISSRFLLTAAHCFICPGCSTDDAVKIRVGVVDISANQSAQDRDIKNITIHENYNYNSKHNDIAIIELHDDVQMSKIVYPACLHQTPDDPLGLVVTGWGLTDPSNTNSRSKLLQVAKLQAVPINTCNDTVLARQRFTKKVIVESQICAISNSSNLSTRQDACQGDSGSPLQLESRAGGYDIVGIVSYGDGCGASVPGIYTRVSAFLDWIEQHVWANVE
ncbi:serine protease persephone [Dendroctonus ponderosae]|uniref:serine protease persephone n=1 Tax=Dendroctonus ponderosae TaxID=77166 RepID=UPI002035D7AD|nr:serine protease persephone [Dendroctonus ponderosae]KAH1025817.1 hypothetical protein HUJ05_010468 [Dendroctonus ponderosae]